MKPLLLITALVLAVAAGYWHVSTRAMNAEIATLSARVAAIEDSVSRLRPLQASHNALARRVNRLNRQAGRVFLTKPLEEETR